MWPNLSSASVGLCFLCFTRVTGLSLTRPLRCELPSESSNSPYLDRPPSLPIRLEDLATFQRRACSLFSLAGCGEDQSFGLMPGPSDARHAPSAMRNRGVISKELCDFLSASPRGDLLEIASGTGCHVEAFAKVLPGWTFLPTECNPDLIPDIEATIEDSGQENIRPPVELDVCSDARIWPRPSAGSEHWDAIMCINMIHIAPEECTRHLMAGAGTSLGIGGRLFMYGPFALDGVLEPDSNKAFHEGLRARSGGKWGIRDAAWVADLADVHGLELTSANPLPANNFFMVFTKVRDADMVQSGDDGNREARVAQLVSKIITPTKDTFLASLAAINK